MDINSFFERYKLNISEKQPKHEVLKQVMVAAIEDGYWKDGEQLPTEKVITALTPFSLGTIQKALASLVLEGYIRRQRGQGTFILPREKRLGGPWIYQALSKDESRFIPMKSFVIRRVEIEVQTPWEKWLRNDKEDQTIMRLHRVITAESHSFLTSYHVNTTLFPLFGDTPLEQLNNENFVYLTQKHYQVILKKIIHTATSALLPGFVTEALKLPKKTYGTHLDMQVVGTKGEAIAYMKMYLPAGGVRLCF